MLTTGTGPSWRSLWNGWECNLDRRHLFLQVKKNGLQEIRTVRMAIGPLDGLLLPNVSRATWTGWLAKSWPTGTTLPCSEANLFLVSLPKHPAPQGTRAAPTHMPALKSPPPVRHTVLPARHCYASPPPFRAQP